MLDRLVSIAAAVAGLGVYVVLVGGVRQGVKLEAAGLPVSVATHASTTADLTASGIRALFIWPAVFLVGVLIASLVERYESGDRYPALFRVAASALSVVFQFLVALLGFTLGLTIVAGAADTATKTAGHGLLIEGIAAGAWFAVPVFAYFAAHWCWRRCASHRTISPPPHAPPDSSGCWAFVRASRIVRYATVHPWRSSIPLGFYVVVSSVMTVLWVESGFTSWAVPALVAAQPFVVGVCAAARTTMRVASSIDTTESRIDGDSLLIVALLIVVVVMPTWLALYVGGVLLLVLLTAPSGRHEITPLSRRILSGARLNRATERAIDEVRQGPAAVAALRGSAVGRAAALATVVAIAAVAFEARTPQTFDEARIPIAQSNDQITAAYLGEAGGRIFLGYCERKPSSGTSEMPRLIVVDADKVAGMTIVANGYSFFREHEGTLVSGITGALGLPTYRPPSWQSISGRQAPQTVCGSDDRRTSREALDELRAGEALD